MVSVDVAVSEPALLGECPVWSPLEGVLYWEDIDGRCIHRLDPSTGVDEQRALPGRPGSFALTERTGLLVVATEHEVVWLDWESGTVTPWLDLEEPGVGIRMNDGRTDAAGRFWVGSMYEDTKANKRVGSLHRIEPDGTTFVERSDVGTANGLAFDPSRERMYFADTPTLSVVMWDYDPQTATRTNERQFFDYETVPGKPDGACVDADGCYWSASVHGWAVTRVTPDGSVDRRIELPVKKPSMPAFAGSAMDQLYVTSIDVDEPGHDGVAQGSLLVIDLSAEGIQGVPEVPFAGLPT